METRSQKRNRRATKIQEAHSRCYVKDRKLQRAREMREVDHTLQEGSRGRLEWPEDTGKWPDSGCTLERKLTS